MKRLISVMLIASILTHTSCTKKLDLDEDTVILIEKQDKLTQLNELFDLSFEDPAKAKADYDLFLAEKLFTSERNYLIDNDIRISNNYTAGVIQMNVGFLATEQNLAKKSVFELYDARFSSYINNRDLFGDIPLQLKNGDRYQRVKDKVAYINSFFDKKIEEKISNSVSDKNVTNKKWIMTKSFYDWGMGIFHNINFDFTLNENKSSVINAFFFTPFARYSNTDENSVTDLQSNLLSTPKYAMYDNKICFFFELKDNIDHVRNAGNIERSWTFEFTYKVEGNTLRLSEPRKRRYAAPSYLKDNFDDESFDTFYSEDFQSFLLETTP